MKTVEQLVFNSPKDRKLGNHQVVWVNNVIRKFIYHWTVICKADMSRKVFTTDNGGFNTQSTSRAINAYKRAFEALGYTYVDKEVF